MQSSLAPHLQDHNYACRPPVTPPPPSPPPAAPGLMGVAGDGAAPSSFTFGIAASGSDAALLSKAAAGPLTREQLNTDTIKEAGVGPMTPLEQGAAAAAAQDGAESSRLSPVASSHGDEDDGGEETETAPEEEEDGKPEKESPRSGPVSAASARSSVDDDDPDEDDDDDGEDDSITRCICDYLHDDGYMICCDKCS